MKPAVAILCPLLLAWVPAQQAVRDAAPLRLKAITTKVTKGDEGNTSSLRVSGTGSVEGVVKTTDAAQRPVPGAIVTVSGAGLPAGRSAITDGDGRFSIGGLPAGRFTLTAKKPAYLPAAYGATRPGRAGVGIVLADGEHIADLTIGISHGAALSGIVRDLSGQPVPNAQMSVLRLGPAGATMVSTTTTDDRGRYRVFGLAPGSYVVSALELSLAQTVAGHMTTAQVDATLDALRRGRAAGAIAPVVATLPPPPIVNLAPVYYPGVASVAQATPIPLAVGEDHGGTDITIQFSRTASVAGTVVSPSGSSGGITVALVPRDTATLSSGVAPFATMTSSAAPDGRFRFPSVNPGSYVVEARTALPAVRESGPPSPRLWGEAPVDVTGDDIAEVTVELRSPLHFAGRVVFDGGAGPAPAFSQVRVALATGPTGSMLNSPVGIAPSTAILAARAVAADGTFDYEVTPGTVAVSVLAAPPGWVARSAIADGQDLLDSPLTVPPDATTVPPVTITLTTRRTSLIGTVRTSPGQNPSAYFIVVFPPDEALQHAGQRRVRSTRAGTDGTYAFRDLPPGDYLIAALTDLEPDDMFDSTFFDALAASAIAVSLGDGQERTQNLRIGG